jgi:DNA mismatch repair protein MutS2
VDEHTLRVLEFDRIVAELADLALSPQGARLLREQPIETGGNRVAERLALASGLRPILQSGASFPETDFPDVEAPLAAIAKEGAALDGEELAAIGRCILSSLKVRRFVLKGLPAGTAGGSGEEAAARLGELARAIPDLTALSRQIFRIVDHSGALREKDLPALAAIRDRIRRFREDTERVARGMLEGEVSRQYWQTSLVAQRDGRLVLPLKTQFKGRVKGIVHEASSSGSTLFIEPLEMVEMNNAVIQEEGEYRAEVRRILRGLSAETAAHRGELVAMRDAVAVLDSLLARARWAARYGCVPAAPAREGLRLVAARHPLLGASVVPISMGLEAGDRVLIITGPNTGGKTVTLKTVGLLALINQFGMEVPAAPGTELPVFDQVWADIGDEQSISQNLSTFSSHVRNLARFAEQATASSLVLLDELGAGTDPQEGVALAMALLDHLLEKGATVIATTHHGILKNYGATRAGAQNASMGFDGESLSPDFRILMGVPGESHALEIARRQGMGAAVMEAAERYLSDERTDISELVKHLSERHRKLAEVEEEQRARETDLREKRRETDLKALALRQKELELRRQGLKELRAFLDTARRQWEELRAGAPAAGAAETSRQFSALVDGIRDRIAAEEERIASEREGLLPEVDYEPREGMEVVIRTTGRRGRIVRRDRDRRWVVEIGSVRVSLLPGEMAPAAADAAPASQVSVSYTPSEAVGLPAVQLDVRGMRLDEALRALERQIDSALVHGLTEFGVVHGKGEGILQKGIHQYLKASPVVADYYFVPPEEGGFGKTRVILKG